MHPWTKRKDLQERMLKQKICLRDKDANSSPGAAARAFAETWKRNNRDILLTLQLMFPEPLSRHIAKDMQLAQDFSLANELIRLSPIFAAFENRDIDWRYLRTTLLVPHRHWCHRCELCDHPVPHQSNVCTKLCWHRQRHLCWLG